MTRDEREGCNAVRGLLIGLVLAFLIWSVLVAVIVLVVA